MEFFAYNILVDNIDDQNPVPSDFVGGVSPRLNFDNFINSFITVFVLIVNEDWNVIFYYVVNGSG